MSRHHFSRLLQPTFLMIGLTLATIPAIIPYWGEGLPRTNDALPHLYRVLALENALQAGQGWARWSPDLVHGYGYPVFNFFPSLFHLFVAGIDQLGVALTTAYRLAATVHFGLAALGAYVLGRTLYGERSGWVTAIAYVYSPYFLYDAHVRGSLPETQALALLPWLLLALYCCQKGSWRWAGGVAVLFAAMFLSHTAIAVQSAIPMTLFVLVLAWQQGWRSLRYAVVGLLVGGLLTAIYLLPALLELSFTRAELSMSMGYRYSDNFLTLGELFAFPRLPADPALLNPPVVRSLPLVPLAIALFWGVGGWLRGVDSPTRFSRWVWVGMIVLSVWLIMPTSQWVWDNVPLLQLTFFPWRLLGGISLAAALWLGSFIQPSNSWETYAISILVVVAAVPWLFGPREPVPESPTWDDLWAFEVGPLFVGTTTLGEFLPRWVTEIPDTTALRTALERGKEVDRLVPASSLTITRTTGNTLSAQYQYTTPITTTLTYRQFYFPGWTAEIDGKPIPLRPSTPHGLVELDVPVGEHNLTIRLAHTPVQKWGEAISWLGIALAGGLLLIGGNGAHPKKKKSQGAFFSVWLGLGVIAIWFFFAKVETPLRRNTLLAGGVWGKPTITPLDYAGEVRLLSYEPMVVEGTAGTPVQLTLYWQALRPIGVPYVAGVQIIDAQGTVWNSPEISRPRNWRFLSNTNTWNLPNSYRMDPFVLHLLDGTPPGRYQFWVGLVREDTGQTIAGHRVGELVVTEPMRGELALEEGMIVAPERVIINGLHLLGSRLDRSETRPGDPLRVTLLWQVADLSEAQNEVDLLFSNELGTVFFTRMLSIAPNYPIEQWQGGDRLRAEWVGRMPASLPTGSLTIRLTEGTMVGLPIVVHELPRMWEIPTLSHPVSISFGEELILQGAELPAQLSPGEPLSINLAWQAVREMETSYHVFLHLVAADGQIVAQSDGQPDSWNRPTTGWLAQEVLVEERTILVPKELNAGTYSLRVGIYDPLTGQRVVSTIGDAVLLGEWKIP